MKFLQLIFSCLLVFCFWGTSPARAAQPGATGTQKTIDFDFDWRFHLGDVSAAKEKAFDDRQWRKVDVPHDFSIEQDFDLNHPSGWSGAYLPGGIGWYRKTFDWKPAKDQKVFVQFDGVYMNSDVWVNGHHLGKRPYGYISFQYDLSPYLVNGQNVIAVRADNSKLPSSRWYTGSGIYRHVRLAVTQNVFIPTWGTFISTPQVTKDQALVQLQIDLENASGQPTKLTLLTDILEPGGKKVTQVSQQLTLNPGQRTVTQKATISKPKFWSPEKPQRYQAVHRLQNGKQTLQEYTTYFGVRTVEVNAKDGFVLNGQKMKLNGVCNHHDGGPVGSAVPEDVLYRRLKLLKEMGCNAIRTSHNPAAPEFYTMADTMGFLVLDEAFDGWDKPKAKFDYGLYFKDWWQKDLADFIKRDRNHPSVVMWSIGNEVPEFEPERQRELVEALKKLDTTRPVTQARGSSSPYIDIPGFNGEGEMPETLEKFHQKHPDKPLLGTEITHSLQTRGVYASKTSYRTRDFPAPWEDGVKWENFKSKVFMIPDLTQEEVFKNNSKFYQSSYDNAIVRIGVRDQHKRTESLDYLIGTFRWTGFDYLGEATIQPARTANFGILDLAGFPKDHYYLYQSLWSKKPMVHLLPHWTHPGKEGVAIPVVAYTNAETVELFLNGKSLGEQKMPEDLQIVWQVPYQAGTLKAIARQGGKVVAETSVSTAGAASNIRVTPDKKQARANKRDVIHMEVDITDTQGNLAPEADNLVKFTLTGPGKIIGVENGDIIDFASMKIPQRKAFKGKCLVMVQTTDKPGEIVLKANADGLKSGEVKVQVK
ncbi:glycoside hydrolase family 2 TIM barrel-domain containing protein [Rufibacter ruber]|uniref:glycoside hydrolase family 2 TIM barrel-domain containing protein n=1 Tax=Rufibacter ruber TaxID=1783499 RepID=UPI000AACE85B|nr:glycoside hydrolase family 2 TIM barrel-domain containing protein [Rufibacter ruber]